MLLVVHYTTIFNFSSFSIISYGTHTQISRLSSSTCIFFGPLGMLYASFSSAVIMFIITLVVGIFTGGLGLLLTILIGTFWAYSIVQGENQKGK